MTGPSDSRGRSTRPRIGVSDASRKVVIVTGASQGIGAGLVEGFRSAGYAAVGSSRSIDPSDASDFITVRGDIAEFETAQMIVGNAVHRFGRVDSLVNNAGIFISKPFTDYTLEDYLAITTVNLTGFFHITQAAILGVIENPVYDPASYEGLAQLHPLGRVGKTRDVVEGILYLEQASFVTGVVLHIDGGQSAGD
jgi:NAD(P)-dependent dehydrogenase (short-subunit alcohol dehydrogenase family)